MKEIFYISGLPRSGSTLLCNILAQNPDLYVSPATSGCHDVLFNIRNLWDGLGEHQAEGVDYEQLRRVLKSVLCSYHNTEKSLVVDKGRGWISLLEMIEFITEKKPKIIVPVRNITEILASFEKLWRKSTGQSRWGIEDRDYFASQTIEGRCGMWVSADQPVGLAYNRVRDVISRGYKNDLFFLEFDFLTQNPNRAMDMVYDYLELSRFSHNFNLVEQYTKEDDVGHHRIPDLHTIRSKVEPVPHYSLSVLGENVFSKYLNLEIWRN